MLSDVGPRSFTIFVSTTAPTDSNTTTLFDSTSAFGGAGRMRHLPVARISFGVNNSHAGTLLGQESIDGGTTWRTFSSTPVGVPAASTISGPYDFLIDTYHEFRLRWTNGGTTQTTWEPMLKGHENRQPGT